MQDFMLKCHAIYQKVQYNLPTVEANMSRLITKVRWVVESVNGWIKQWRMLNKVIPNTLIPSIGDFVRITCPLAIVSVLHFLQQKIRYTWSVNAHQSTEIYRTKPAATVFTGKWTPQQEKVYTYLKDCDHILHNFQKLSLDDLRNITLGVYM